jgi:hypothetical protein
MNRAQRRASTFKRAQRYDRNHVEPSAVLKPIIMSRTFDADEAAKISVDTRMAWHRLTHGEGTEADFDLLANTSNIALVRAEALGELAVETVLRAQASILQMRDRYRRTGRFGADAQALQTVPNMLDFYDQLLDHSSPQLMLEALEATVRRMAVLIEGERV